MDRQAAERSTGLSGNSRVASSGNQEFLFDDLEEQLEALRSVPSDDEDEEEDKKPAAKQKYDSVAEEKKEEGEEMDCPICLSDSPEIKNSLAWGPCRHACCMHCLDEFLNQLPRRKILQAATDKGQQRVTTAHGKCPICRAEISFFELTHVQTGNLVVPRIGVSSASFPTGNAGSGAQTARSPASIPSSATLPSLPSATQQTTTTRPPELRGLYKWFTRDNATKLSTGTLCFSKALHQASTIELPSLRKAVPFTEEAFHAPTRTFWGLAEIPPDPSDTFYHNSVGKHQIVRVVWSFLPDYSAVSRGFVLLEDDCRKQAATTAQATKKHGLLDGIWSILSPSGDKRLVFIEDDVLRTTGGWPARTIVAEDGTISFEFCSYSNNDNDEGESLAGWNLQWDKPTTAPASGETLVMRKGTEQAEEWTRLTMGLFNKCPRIAPQQSSRKHQKSTVHMGGATGCYAVTRPASPPHLPITSSCRGQLWGSTYLNETLMVGSESLHFLQSAAEGAYLSFSDMKGQKLDSRLPLPKIMPFRNISMKTTHTFEGEIQWVEDCGTTFRGHSKWICKYQFDSTFTCTLRGTISMVPATVQARATKRDVIYCNAAFGNGGGAPLEDPHWKDRLRIQGASAKTLSLLNWLMPNTAGAF